MAQQEVPSRQLQISHQKSRRAVIVGGLRTPFVKSLTVFKHMSALDLASCLLAELVARMDMDPACIDRLVYGQTALQPEIPNIARELVFQSALPMGLDAYSVSRACATSTQALVEGAQAIVEGEVQVVLCGGVDSLSHPAVTFQDRFVEALMDAYAAKEPAAKARAFLKLKPKDILPKSPALREFTTGLTMGESAEKMAQINGISRQAQDKLAWQSHQKAAAAWKSGVLDQEVMPLWVPPAYGHVVDRDTLVRPDVSLERLAQLRPVFDTRYGTLTAGNSSPVSDGASAVVLMEEKRAEELGFEPLAAVKAWAFAAVDPGWQLLMGPALAIPQALERAQLRWDQVDIVDMHEAFAAQVLSNLQALASETWMQTYAGRPQALGEVSPEKLNIYGGSISIGHPLAATGTRQALSMAHALKRRGRGTALISQCAAGGLGAAVVLER